MQTPTSLEVDRFVAPLGTDFATIAQVIETAGDGLVIVDSAWRYRYVNAVVERMLQRPAAEIIGRSAWDVLPQAVEGQTYRHYRRAMAERNPITFEEYSPIFDVWLEHRCLPMDDGGLLVFFRDISSRKRAEVACDASKAHLAAVVGAAREAIIGMDASLRIVVFNPAAEQMFGWTEDEVIGSPLERLLPARVRQRYHRHLSRQGTTAQKPSVPIRALFTARDKEGTEFPIEASISHVDVNGQRLYAAVVRDISDSRQAEQERERLRRERERLHRERERDAARRRAFVRDVLFSVTEGRLRFCQHEGELPRKLSLMAVACCCSSAALHEVRTAALNAARRCGLSDDRANDLVLAVGEAAMNTVVHAGGGRCLVCGDPETGTVQIWLVDDGRGIEMDVLPRATLERGYTTSGGMGHGFKMMLACTDRVWLMTGARGTTVVLEQGGPQSGTMSFTGIGEWVPLVQPKL